jgi:heme/copper-type cytochrome/quinol oxidase subunit 3
MATAVTAEHLQQAHGGGHGGEMDHADHPPTSLGLNHRKLLMWLFLASDCMFFGALIATYMIYRGRAEDIGIGGEIPGVVRSGGPFPDQILDIPYTSVSAFVLLMSSLTMVLALAGIQQNNMRKLRIWLLGTALLGSVFLGGQYFEFSEFFHEGLSLQENIFGATFFTLTGFHGAHVTVGVIWLLSLLVVSLRGGLTQKDALSVEIAGLYWHFVDIVWIVIFTLVYLIPYDEAPELVEEGGEHAVAPFVTVGHLIAQLGPW